MGNKNIFRQDGTAPEFEPAINLGFDAQNADDIIFNFGNDATPAEEMFEKAEDNLVFNITEADGQVKTGNAKKQKAAKITPSEHSSPAVLKTEKAEEKKI